MDVAKWLKICVNAGVAVVMAASVCGTAAAAPAAADAPATAPSAERDGIFAEEKVGDLIGLTPEQVLTRLTKGARFDPASLGKAKSVKFDPNPRAFSAVLGGDVIELYEEAWFARSRLPYCVAGFVSAARRETVTRYEYATAGMLLFRNGRFEGLLADLPLPPRGRSAWLAGNPFESPDDDLPLANGLEGVLARMGGKVPDDTVLVTLCPKKYWPSSAEPVTGDAAEAAPKPTSLLSDLRTGDAVDIDLAAFAKAHSDVILYRGFKPKYVVLAIRSNPPETRNFRFIGVEDRRVVWIAQSLIGSPGGFIGQAICHGETGARRENCGWGAFAYPFAEGGQVFRGDCPGTACAADPLPSDAIALDPHIAEVGPCVWRGFSAGEQKGLLGVQAVGGGAALHDALGEIPNLKARIVNCDANYAKHPDYTEEVVYDRILRETALQYFRTVNVNPTDLDALLAKKLRAKAEIDYVAWSRNDPKYREQPLTQEEVGDITALVKSIPDPPAFELLKREPSPSFSLAQERDLFEYFVGSYWAGQAQETLVVRRLTDPSFVPPPAPDFRANAHQ